MTRILVVEDNADLAFGLRNNLEIEGYAVTVAENGARGLEAVRQEVPDLLILDLMLPKMSGFAVLKALRSEGCDVPVLILTAKGEEADKVVGLRLGADDYVTKPFGVLELLARVEAILRRTGTNGDRGHEAGGSVHAFGDVVVDTAARSIVKRGAEVSVTPKEFDLLVALIRREGAVASRVTLMKEVWGHRSAIASRTVDTHIAELRRKLEDEPPDPRWILTVHKAGYRFRS